MIPCLPNNTFFPVQLTIELAIINPIQLEIATMIVFMYTCWSTST